MNKVILNKATKYRSLTHNDFALGKLPPQALDLEESILGAVMLEKGAISKVAFLKSDFFYHDGNQRIYQACVNLAATSRPIDMRTVVAELRSMGSLEVTGGAHYIAELTSKVSSAANIEYHARIIIEYAIKRKLIEIAGKLMNSAYDDTIDVFELLEENEMLLYNLGRLTGAGRDFKDGVQLGYETIQEISERIGRADGLSGVPSGFTAVDRITHGWQKAELIIIAARPGMGKTSLVCTITEKLIVQFNIPVGLFSLEMRDVELMTRLFSINTEVDSEKIKKGKLNQIEVSILTQSKVASKNLYVDDTPGLGIMQLRSKARRMVESMGVKIIIIDYLQLMRLENHTGNREQEVAAISRSLKEISKELNIPVIALSQLSRAVELRGGDKRPQLSDLRESGAIEQDADVVAFLYRPEYYKITSLENGESSAGAAELIIAKNRNGRTDTAQIKFSSKYTKFLDTESPFDRESTHPTWQGDDDQPF